MPNLSMTVYLPELDRERYLNDFQKSIHDAMIAAARKFVEVAIPLIPVWTGMASGALENLEILTGQTISRDSPKVTRGYYYYPGRQLRTPELGQSLTTQPNAILVATGSRVYFTFDVGINYFNVLDAEKWGAFLAGIQAFNAELRDQLERLRPNIGDYFVRRRYL